jgi:hypothetical protein
MIPFDPSKITTEFVLLKSITQALGGSISVVDEEKTIGKKEILKRLPVPLSVARAFIMKHKKLTRYLKPVVTAITRYDGRIISLERHPLGTMGELHYEGLSGELVTWESSSQVNFKKNILPMLMNNKRNWFFDGRYIFSFEDQNLDDVIAKSTSITTDNHFRKLIATSIDTQDLSNAEKLYPTERSCVAFVTSDGEYVISPPIWKELGSVGASRRNEDDAVAPTMSFDSIDETMSVNLNFALKAGNEIGALFGYEFIEPLHLPRLMTEMHTVNLPNIPKQIKATYDIGIKFTHSLAWMLGLLRKANTLETYVMLRSLIKYLTTKGIYRNNVFDASLVFQPTQDVSNVVLRDLNQILDAKDFTYTTIRSIIAQSKKAKHHVSFGNITNIAGLQTEQE